MWGGRLPLRVGGVRARGPSSDERAAAPCHYAAPCPPRSRLHRPTTLSPCTLPCPILSEEDSFTVSTFLEALKEEAAASAGYFGDTGLVMETASSSGAVDVSGISAGKEGAIGEGWGRARGRVQALQGRGRGARDRVSLYGLNSCPLPPFRSGGSDRDAQARIGHPLGRVLTGVSCGEHTVGDTED